MDFKPSPRLKRHRPIRVASWFIIQFLFVACAATSKPSTNHLANQTSPYLKEHAGDPVDWYPWGTKAFDRAKRENKPIFLSIGYSACHWCHVMQREDFEDAKVAELLNMFFVSVLVDREERPDIDRQYMAVCEMLTGSGGWPLVIVMTPDRQPFFASTYIPRESAGGRMGMLELLPKIARDWKSSPGDLQKNGEKLSRLMAAALVRDAPGDLPGIPTLTAGFRQLASNFDARYGGFGGAPKFPPSLQIFFLLRCWKRTGDARALAMVEKTLDSMRAGGIFDQLGFGFHRYTTDAAWRVPHFEKMLYDQALISMALTEAYQATHKPRFAKTAHEIFDYVHRQLTSPEGAFYDAEDADSNGREGAYYVWTEKQIRGAVGTADAALAIKTYGVRETGNFPGGEKGENILERPASSEMLAQEFSLSPGELDQRLEAVRAKLFAARSMRTAPRKDTKILTAWNGLMIAALAKAAQADGDLNSSQAAERAADFILANMRTGDGRLLHSFADGRAAGPANLEDYAFLTWGLIELYEADFKLAYLEAALNLNRQTLQHFGDEKKGGFFFTADDDRNNLAREKSLDDTDLPSGNSVAALNLARLGEMTGDAALREKANATLRAFAGLVQKSPADYAQSLAAVDFVAGPAYEVVIAGDSHAADTRAMLQAAVARFVPNKVVLLRPTEGEATGIVRVADYTRYQSGLDGKATAYVCIRTVCKLPTHDTDKMLQLMGAASP
jgi:uncharacterized protein